MYTAALIGLGDIAWKFDRRGAEKDFSKSQAGAMIAHPEIRLLGGCSPDSEDRRLFEAWLPGASTYADAKDMLAALKPDLVGVCSPTGHHFEHVNRCLEFGAKAIWLEKPPADSLHNLDMLIAASSEAKTTILVNFIRRYLPVYERLREAFRQKWYGPCRLIRILYSPGLARNGIHLLDQLFYLTGADGYDLLWVERTAGHSPGFSLRLSDGTLVQASGVDVPYHTNDISLVCELGVASVLRGGKKASVEKSGENDAFPGFYDLHRIDDERLGKTSLAGCMDAALADLVECMVDGERPRSDLSSARLSQALLGDILDKAKA